MIRNQWYVVLESNEVKMGKTFGITRMGEKLVFWRQPNGQVVCMADQCPHLGASLCMGKIHDDRLACPFHGFEFDPEGRCKYLPAYGMNADIPKALEVHTYATFETHGLIWIFWGDLPQNLEPPKFFPSIQTGFSFRSFHQHWPVHYSRVIENQLDVAHLPFVHKNTIGRGNKTVVDGPYFQIDGDLLNLWVYNRNDDGTPRKSTNEIPTPQRNPFLQFRFPNLWQNWISDDIHILIAFVPVDNENTIMLGRYYQKTVKVPLLREIFNFIGVQSSIYIANQDRRIVSHQLPKKSGLKKMGEKILLSDGAILAYRKYRQTLKEEAGQED